MAFKGWIKKYEHLYHDVQTGEEYDPSEDDALLDTDDGIVSSKDTDKENREAEDGEAAGVSSRGKASPSHLKALALPPIR